MIHRNTIQSLEEFEFARDLIRENKQKKLMLSCK